MEFASCLLVILVILIVEEFFISIEKETVSFYCQMKGMSDGEPTRWQHDGIYPHPINPCMYTYDSRLYCCKTVDAHCSNIIKS